ncbi:MAG: tripartite tricarboxylate transporter TctB family protein [Paracoccus sp. (in: a-proteobacteria)]|uniref:tripartite tricarboxylate transporter TctB family protein n=1 Tax=Paracoccus sp. TaxID=267 RepID=UPI0039E2E256
MSEIDREPKRRPDLAALIIAVGLALIAGVMLWDSARLTDLGGYSGVSPATIPRVVAWCLLGLAAWTALEALRGDFPERPAQNPQPVLWIIGGLALQLMTLHAAGFSIATGLLFAATARAFGKRNLALNLAIGITVSFFVWAVFSQLLMLHLPAGPLEKLIFPGG